MSTSNNIHSSDTSAISTVTPNSQKRAPLSQTMAGEKIYKLSTFSDQIEAKPGDTIKVRVPKLTWQSDECIIPESLCLEFNLEISGTKTWARNNLAALLKKHLQIRVGDEIVYDNTREGRLQLYKDLWLSSHRRAKMLRHGVGSEDYRKHLAGDDSASSSTKTGKIKNADLMPLHKSLKIPLGHILKNHGPYSPGNMNLIVEYQITLPENDEILEVQSSQTMGSYKLTNIRYGFQSIKNREMVAEVMAPYLANGRELIFQNCKVEETTKWLKDNTEEIVNIRANRKSLTYIVGLFKYTDQKEDEEFVYPNIEEVKIEVNGDPNKLFSNGMTKNEMFEEAEKVFAVDHSDVAMSDFFHDRYALVLDFRTVSDDKVYGGGINTNDGGRVHLIVKKKATSKDVDCTFYVFSDAAVVVNKNVLLKFSK